VKSLESVSQYMYYTVYVLYKVTAKTTFQNLEPSFLRGKSPEKRSRSLVQVLTSQCPGLFTDIKSPWSIFLRILLNGNKQQTLPNYAV